jgi:dihydrofolate reductase
MVDFARIWKDKPKLVVSTTLDTVGWNSRLVRDNLAEEITRLKSQPGGFLELGGAALAAKCIELGLVDEFQPIVHPVVLGGGTPYLPAVRSAIGLRLVETKRFGSGVVYLRYERARD